MNSAELVFEHQDGLLRFPVRRAVYCVSPEGSFSCSVECDANPAHAYLSEPCFCFMRCPIGAPALKPGMVLGIAHRQGERDSFDLPSTHLYVGSHFDPWDATVEMIAVDGDEVEAVIRFTTDDPNYYGERAAATPGSCRVRLRQVRPGEVRDLM